jgi:hypothetical protein
MKRFITILLLMIAATILVSAKNPVKHDDPNAVIVHEWGTFTSIAGRNGEAVEWTPLGGTTDLPCFVHRLPNGNNNSNIKGPVYAGGLSATVRMETPVLYFYASRPQTVNVNVRFRQGLISEWYPQADITPANSAGFDGSKKFESNATWRDIKIMPGTTPEFPAEAARSHYYAARDTDAAPLSKSSQTEKFLFYRGIGRFRLPIVATVEGETIRIKNRAAEDIRSVILFENRNGKIGFRIHHGLRDEVRLESPTLNGGVESVVSALEAILVENGLYPKEAKAMIETWRDSWFEHGSRLIYIYPESEIDSVLPLDIKPAPVRTARVFVGRIELITATTEREVGQAIAENDRVALEKYGRFLPAIAGQMGRSLARVDIRILQPVCNN